jgi:hypothetical protein
MRYRQVHVVMREGDGFVVEGVLWLGGFQLLDAESQGLGVSVRECM